MNEGADAGRHQPDDLLLGAHAHVPCLLPRGVRSRHVAGLRVASGGLFAPLPPHLATMPNTAGLPA